MKKILFGLSLLACAAGATADVTAAAHCVSFAPAGFCDSMQYDNGLKATWISYDCAGSNGKQTKALYYTGKTFCDGTTGCNPAAAYGFDSLSWKFNKTASTGTLTGVLAGSPVTLQQDIPVAITNGVCTAAEISGGRSSLDF